MDCEIASGPDIQRFLDDAAAATAEFARKTGVSYVIPPDHYKLDRNCASEYHDVDGPLSLGQSVLARLASCCSAGPRTTVVGPDRKKRIVQARGWKTAPFILGTEIGEKLGSTVITYNLIVYLTSKMKLPLVKAVYISSASFGASSLAPLLGVFLADAYLGNFTTVAAGSIFYLGGLVLFTLLVMEKYLQPPNCKVDTFVSRCGEATSFQMTILFLSLTLQTVGSGGIRPCAAVCGVDQFDESNPDQQKQIQNFFSWRKVWMASAMVAATTVVIWIQTNVDWGWGSLFVSMTMMVSVALLLLGIPFYLTFHANGSPLMSLGQVLLAAIRKRKLSLPENPNMLYQVKTQDVNDVLPHTENMRWLDKAAVLEIWKKVYIDQSDSWMLCTVQQVEELKQILRMAPVWLCTGVSAIVYIQTFTVMTKQAMTMDLSVGKNFEVPAASMGAISILTFLLFVPLYDAYLVKVLRKLTRQARGLTCLQRIGVGIFIGILTTSLAAIVESKRRDVAIRSHLSFGRDSNVPISGLWLVPQFVLAGLGESFVVPGLLEFFNEETPTKFQGMGKSVVWAALGTGGVLNAALVSILQCVTRAQTSQPNGWLHDHINRGRLDYFYCTLVILGTLVFLIYGFITSYYSYTVKTNLEPGHFKFDRTEQVRMQ